MQLTMLHVACVLKTGSMSSNFNETRFALELPASLAEDFMDNEYCGTTHGNKLRVMVAFPSPDVAKLLSQVCIP